MAKPVGDAMSADGFYNIYPTGNPAAYGMNPIHGMKQCTWDAFRLQLAVFGMDADGNPIPGFQGKVKMKAKNTAGQFTPFDFGHFYLAGWGDVEMYVPVEVTGEIIGGLKFEQADSSISPGHFLYGKTAMTTIRNGAGAMLIYAEDGSAVRVRNLVSRDAYAIFSGTYGYTDTELSNVWIVDERQEPTDPNMVLGLYAHSSGRWAVKNCAFRGDPESAGASYWEGGIAYAGIVPYYLYNGASVELIDNDVATTDPRSPDDERWALGLFFNGTCQWMDEGGNCMYDPAKPVQMLVQGNRATSCQGLLIAYNNAVTTVQNNSFHVVGLPNYWGDAAGINHMFSRMAAINNRFSGGDQNGFGIFSIGYGDSIQNNNFIGMELPGFYGGYPCVLLLGEGCKVDEQAMLGVKYFPQETTLCQQVLDLGVDNDVLQWGKLCGGTHPAFDRIQMNQQKLIEHKMRMEGFAAGGAGAPRSLKPWFGNRGGQR